MRIKTISRPIPIKLEPTPPRILMIPMTVRNNAAHSIHTALAIRPRRSLEIAREGDGVRGRVASRRVGAEAGAELVVDLLVRECPVCGGDEGEVYVIVAVAVVDAVFAGSGGAIRGLLLAVSGRGWGGNGGWRDYLLVQHAGDQVLAKPTSASEAVDGT